MHEQMAEMFFINEIRQEAEEEAKKKAAEAAGRSVSHQNIQPQKASHLRIHHGSTNLQSIHESSSYVS